ncbi:MAG: type II toxin-antitoxin system HicA family toxin [Acidithiobacillus sp.]
MRLPRDLTGTELVQSLGRVGYTVTRQTGSHMRLTSAVQGEHHVTVPCHDPLRLGTLAAILEAVDSVAGSSWISVRMPMD